MSLIFSAIQSHHLESEVLGVLTCFDEIQFNQAKYTLLVTMTFPLVSFNSGTPMSCPWASICPSSGRDQSWGLSFDLSDWHSHSHVLIFFLLV